MILGNETTLDGAVKCLLQIRSYKPFKYSGTWFVGQIGNEFHAHRTLALLKRKAARAGAEYLNYAKVGS